MAFVDMGDQFVALMRAAGDARTRIGTSASSSTTRRRCARPRVAAGIDGLAASLARPSRSVGEPAPGGRLPEIQFTKAPEVLAGMGLDGLGKTDAALAELRAKGIGQAP
jgi:hypothetical protein